MSKIHSKCLIFSAGAQNWQSLLCLNMCAIEGRSNIAALSYQRCFVLSLQRSELDCILKRNQPRPSWSALSQKEKLFSLQYITCVNVTTNGNLRNNVHCWKPTERVFSPFRNESGEKSNPGCRLGTWPVLHVQPAGKRQRTRLWQADGVWGSLPTTDFRGCFCKKRKKNNIQLILFFAKAKTDLYSAIPK